MKALRLLQTKKGRKESGYFCLEGVNLVKDIPDSAEISAVYVAKSREELLPLAESKSKNVCILSDNVFAAVSDTETPQGILAVAKIPAERKPSGNMLVLDGISDMGNLGTMLRTAAAFGVSDVLLLNSADPYAGKSVRASMGGIFYLNLIRSDSLSGLVDGYTLYALDMGGEDIKYASKDGKIALIVGSEAHGISSESRSVAARILSVPMKNMESLNAAVACGIAMYKLFI